MKDQYKVAIAVGTAVGVQYGQSGILWQAALAGLIAAALSITLISIFKQD